MKYAAIHIVSESSDHYTFLVIGETIAEMVDKVLTECPEPPRQWAQIHCADNTTSKQLATALEIRKGGEQ